MNKMIRDLSIKLSRKKARIRELLGIDTRSEGEQTELASLEGEIEGVELELRAAMLAEDDAPEVTQADTREASEVRSLADQASLGRIFGAVIEHRAVDGAERELQQHFGLADNQVPLAMLEARAVTPAPTSVGQQQQAIIPGVFPQSAAAFLGVDMPRVGTGEAVFPVLTTNAAVRTPDEGGAAAETTGSFSAEVLSPSRLQASFFYSREDRARFAGMDAALRQNLADALADGLDAQVIAGDDGLLGGTNLAANAVTAVTDYAGYRKNLAYGRVDGRYATHVQDIRIVMGAATYEHASTVFRSAQAAGVSALEDLMVITGGVRVSAHVPAAAANKQNAIVRMGMRRDAVAPIWEGVTLIPDEITKASTGEIVVTAVMLHAVKVLRTAGFRKQQTQHA